MIGNAIRFVLTNLPTILFVLALVLPTVLGRRNADDYLAWLLLLAVGADSLWAGLYHVMDPQTAANFIGWQVSPFQFEIGIADIALGLTAIISFWRSLEFKAAVIAYTTIFCIGVAYGHIHQIITAGNYAPGNSGALLILTIIKPPLLIWLLVRARRLPSRWERQA